ncbi:hypothetical protein DPX16_3859 [Anabarilius grahami]|uniref:Uncharacterized protein n=1 Tax=Anabarilius grahami TaxID=495550 RepID=A0A3N0XTF8_ANAGA|nr:hypothetical protein DPX16_3859 [Anabarilius grahami]
MRPVAFSLRLQSVFKFHVNCALGAAIHKVVKEKLHKQNRLERMRATATMEAFIDERLCEERQRESEYLWEYVCFKVFAIWVHMLRAGTKGQEKEGRGEVTQNNE